VTGRTRLSKSELRIARIVWDLGEATVHDVLEAIPDDWDLEYKTVQTFLRRLEEKGYVSADRSGRRTRFTATVRPVEVIGDRVSELVDGLFGGDPLPLVEHLLDSHRFTPAEIHRLRQMLQGGPRAST
jgi:BlaI family transcriptional regulator, penicillinase repressor